MDERIQAEVHLLVARVPGHEILEEGLWVRIPPIELTEGWLYESIPIAFQFPPSGYPQSPFYGFYVPTGLRFNGEAPTNFTDPAPAQPPFPGVSWAFFSGNPEPWNPSADLLAGSNVLTWICSIQQRLREGK